MKNNVIIVIANQKGGVGKSTIATNTAAILAAKKQVLLIDHDTSHVSLNFWNRRQYLKDIPQFGISQPKDLDEMTKYLESEFYDVTIVDLGGFTDDLAKAALVYADLIVIPTSTSTQDMDGNIHFMDTLDKLKAVGVSSKAVYVANNTDPRMKQARIDSELDYITDNGYKVIATVPHYVAFSASHGGGMSIVEFASESKAAAAMLNLAVKIMMEAINE